MGEPKEKSVSHNRTQLNMSKLNRISQPIIERSNFVIQITSLWISESIVQSILMKFISKE